MNNSDKKESVVLLLFAAFFFVVILILISGGCTPTITPTPVSASPEQQSFNYDSTTIHIDDDTIIRFVDYDSGVICYMYRAWEQKSFYNYFGLAGGIDCIPLSEIDLDL